MNVSLMDEALHRQHDELEDTHWWFIGRRAVVESTLRDFLVGASSERAILDVGCGTGGMLNLLKEFGEPVGLDSSNQAAERAHQKTGCRVIWGALPSPVSFEPASFDIITSFDCLEHIDDDAAALTAIRGLLRAGGLFLCTVPAFQFLWSVHDDLNGHKRRYTRAGLRRKLEATGLIILKISYFNSILFPVVWAIRLLGKPLRRKTSDFSVPTFGLNRTLAAVFSAERFLLSSISLPFGVSLLAVARKPDQGENTTQSRPESRAAPNHSVSLARENIGLET